MPSSDNPVQKCASPFGRSSLAGLITAARRVSFLAFTRGFLASIACVTSTAGQSCGSSAPVVLNSALNGRRIADELLSRMAAATSLPQCALAALSGPPDATRFATVRPGGTVRTSMTRSGGRIPLREVRKLCPYSDFVGICLEPHRAEPSC
eukprot:CAMPEP_0175999782 /NCGR_PEP_ID=MMETSP0108-20121206/57465_1 /TAXON_ID=195067 ORGANISM="Goniomonas pacifica, Strain CCMP1869" /NCGR_SAMPLE_ID=MMETSP0108 /ASSEMBLY_ACC=CAM_ASM_000204 /LENGTH=150 /DNA_ID=CAMNT_0017332227 /DNA_START=158 /DNA_END=611 /DNA_ORIENTATION=-